MLYTISNKFASINNRLTKKYVDPYNPLDLPPNTVRVRTSDGQAPVKFTGYTSTSYETATLVAGTSDAYDVYKSGTDFTNLLLRSTNVVEVLGANTTNITNMARMFTECSSLTRVSLFDTSNVTSMASMFEVCDVLKSVPRFNTSKVTDISKMLSYCRALKSVPLFDTSNVTDMYMMLAVCTSIKSIPLFDTSKVTTMGSMCSDCYNVETGALALYQQASSQAVPPIYYESAFYNCGRDTTTGAAELAQIPDDWK